MRLPYEDISLSRWKYASRKKLREGHFLKKVVILLWTAKEKLHLLAKV